MWPSRSGGGVRRLFRLAFRSAARIADDVDAELEFHFAERIDELVAGGATRAAARAQARREFGDVEAARRALLAADSRHEQQLRVHDWVSALAQDVRFGVRGLRRSPGFTLVAAATLAVGVGASTALFGVVDRVLLKPLPYVDADRVMTVWQQRRADGERSDVAPGTFLDLRARSRAFTALAAAEPYGLDLLTADGLETLRTWLVSDDFFRVLGVRAQLGRTLTAQDYVEGSGHVVVLGDKLWRSRFGGDPGVVGRTLTLDGEPRTVVGVMPPGFAFPPGRDLWAPRIITAEDRARRGSGYWLVLGRLAPGVSAVQAGADVAAVARQLAAEYPRTNADTDLLAVPLDEELLGAVRPALLLLLGASGLVLLIACANVANLVLARTLARDRELGVRAALGAGRGRIVRLLAVESALLAAVGGALGVGVAWAGVRAIRALGPADLPHIDELGLDARALAFALASSALTALLFGLAPAARSAGTGWQGGLNGSGRTTTAGPASRRARGALVVAEVALSLVLLVGAGLLVRSFVSLLRIDRGYRTDHVTAATVQAWNEYPTGPQRVRFARHVVERLAALPGVRAVGMTSSLPLAESIGAHRARFHVNGRDVPRDEDAPVAHVTVATEGYFDVLGIALRHGRLLTSADDADSRPVVLVTEALARRYFPGEDPVGRELVLGFMGPPITREIVGVVADLRQTGLAADPGPAVFIPHPQAPTGAMTFVVRTTGDPALLLGPMKAEFSAINRALPITGATTLDAVLGGVVRERRFHLALLTAFAATALLLAGIGLYGVLGHAVRERGREIGVRLALGADAPAVLRLILGDGVRLTLAGAALGLLAAAGGARVLRGMLFRVEPLDGVTFVSVTLLVLLVAAVASLIPAWRAARLDPLVTLREE